MGKIKTTIGFVTEEEGAPDVFDPVLVEHPYTMDVISNYRRIEGSSSINDNIVLNNKFSVLADSYAYEHHENIRYVTYLGTKWKVTNVEIGRPRLILTVGGVYNEQEEN